MIFWWREGVRQNVISHDEGGGALHFNFFLSFNKYILLYEFEYEFDRCLQSKRDKKNQIFSFSPFIYIVDILQINYRPVKNVS